MAIANPNYHLNRYQNIPTFDGNPKQINRFITACDNFFDTHRNRENVNAPINICLFDTILSKLVGRAADIIASRVELANCNLVSQARINTFSHQRSIDCVVEDLLNLKPDRNENPQSFGIRIQDTRSSFFKNKYVS